MTALEHVSSRLVRLPLGAARGGSGATEVQLALVAVRDADGVEGTGFTYSLGPGARAARALVDELAADRVVGLDPLDWARTWHELWAVTHRLGRGVALAAISALDIAVWDLRARRAGLPLYRLLGAQRERVPIYGSGRATHQMSTDELVDGALAYVEEGYRAVKLRAGALGAERDLARVAAVREAVGADVRIMVDCNERFDAATALWLGRELEGLGVHWLEEPLIADDAAGHARLADRLRIPIAVGEHLQGRFEFADYLRRGAASVLQPDAPLMGGVSEWCRVCTLADAHGASISPHFLPELHVQLAAASRPCTYLEHFPLIDDLLAERIEVEAGEAIPPRRPGHGIAWDEDALARFAVA